MPVSKLNLYCDHERGKYTLRFEDAADSDCFPSTEEAIRFAGSIVKEETPLTIYDFGGKTLIKTTVFPDPG